MLKYDEKLYILKNVTVREKLLKRHYNNVLTKHFNINKIKKLLIKKYYWKYIIKNIKIYVKTCDIC